MDIWSKYLEFCSLDILSSGESFHSYINSHIVPSSSFFSLLKSLWCPHLKYMPISSAVKGFYKQYPHLTVPAERSLPFDQITIWTSTVFPDLLHCRLRPVTQPQMFSLFFSARKCALFPSRKTVLIKKAAFVFLFEISWLVSNIEIKHLALYQQQILF